MPPTRPCPALAIFLGCGLCALACGEARRPVRQPGNGRPSADAAPHEDAGSSEGDAGEGTPDFGFLFEDGSVPDFGFVFPDATEESRDADAFDANPAPDAEAFDFGFVFPDAAAPRDATPSDVQFPFFDAAGPADSGPPPQTQVSFVPMTSMVRIANSDVEFSAQLDYSNSGPGSQTISVTRAEVGMLIAVLTVQTFSVAPSHVATVGNSRASVAKVPGSGTAPVDPTVATFACALGQVQVQLEFSNGTSVTDSVVPVCQ